MMIPLLMTAPQPESNLRIVQPLSPFERATAMQRNEIDRAKQIADVIALFAYGSAAVFEELPTGEQSRLLNLAIHTLRSGNPKWVQAAQRHALEQGAEAIMGLKTPRAVVDDILEAYLGITEGRHNLPVETYLKIVEGE